MRTAVVTGAAGHVGTSLVAALLERRFAVTAVDIGHRGGAADAALRRVVADVRDGAAMRAVMRGADVVFHCAAVISVVGGRRGLVESVNVMGTRSVVDAAVAEGVPRLVHCSSVHAFDLEGCRGGVVSESSPRAGAAHAAYDRSKAAGEEQVRAGVARGLGAVIVNPTGIIGPDDPGRSRMGVVLRAVQRGRVPLVVAGGFDWVDVRDVAASMIAAVDRGRVGANYLLAGHRLSLAELAGRAAAASGRTSRPRSVPSALVRAAGPAATAVARMWPHPLLPTVEAMAALRSDPVVDGAAARRDLGHRARPVEQTLADIHQDSLRIGYRRRAG